MDTRSDWERAVDATTTLLVPGDVVFVANDQVALPETGPFLRGVPGPTDESGFARILLIRQPDGTVPELAQRRLFGDVELLVWSTAGEQLLAGAAEVVEGASLEVVRGSIRLPCARGDGAAPFVCDRVGGARPLRTEGSQLALEGISNGTLELKGHHPAGATRMEIRVVAGSPHLQAKAGLGGGALPVGPAPRSLSVLGGTPFALGIGPRQVGTVALTWWGTASSWSPLHPECAQAGRDARQRREQQIVLEAYRRGGAGLSCALLRTAPKPAR